MFLARPRGKRQSSLLARRGATVNPLTGVAERHEMPGKTAAGSGISALGGRVLHPHGLRFCRKPALRCGAFTSKDANNALTKVVP